MTLAIKGNSPEVVNKYQGFAPVKVIHAVKNAAEKTGADFAFLMEKASAESGFNPAAKARTSSATGLFQFIEKTWLSMIKQHGAKHGLKAYADQITLKNGKPCVDNCDAEKEILALRKNPEISALMAAEFSAENKQYLQAHTKGAVGAPELYMAHFMGAPAAAKFLNCRDCAPDAVGAEFFPAAAKANKAVFYDAETGKPRTVNEIYNFFAKKFGKDTGGTPSSTQAVAPSPHMTAYTRSAAAPRPTPPLDMAGALPFFDDSNESDDIIWNDDPRINRIPGQKLAPMSILTLAMAAGNNDSRDKFGFNS